MRGVAGPDPGKRSIHLINRQTYNDEHDEVAIPQAAYPGIAIPIAISDLHIIMTYAGRVTISLLHFAVSTACERQIGNNIVTL